MNHVTFIFESCPTYECLVSSHICTRHVTRTHESCHTNESQCCHWWVTCTICHTDKSCVACMSSWLTILPAGCTWMSHVSQINGVCHTREQKKQLTILPVWAPKTNKKTYSHHKWVMNEYWHRYEWVVRVWMLPKKKLIKKKLTIFPVGSSEIDWNCTCMCDMTH